MSRLSGGQTEMGAMNGVSGLHYGQCWSYRAIVIETGNIIFYENWSNECVLDKNGDQRHFCCAFKMLL